MKLTLRIGGGFAGLVSVTTVDSGTLPPELAQELDLEVERAGLRSASEAPTVDPPAASRRRPDAQLYELTLHNGGDELDLHFTDETLPTGVEHLVHWMRQCPGRQESLEP